MRSACRSRRCTASTDASGDAMFERFTADARVVAQAARTHAIRLGHRWTGTEHLLLALSTDGRSTAPILESFGADREQAAASLGASRFTALRRVVLPEVLPALLTGFSLAFARGLGEYGSVIFIAGNKPYQTEIAPLLITIRLEEYDYNGAVGLAAVMLAASFLCLLAINLIPLLFRHERRSRRDG